MLNQIDKYIGYPPIFILHYKSIYSIDLLRLTNSVFILSRSWPSLSSWPFSWPLLLLSPVATAITVDMVMDTMVATVVDTAKDMDMATDTGVDMAKDTAMATDTGVDMAKDTDMEVVVDMAKAMAITGGD